MINRRLFQMADVVGSQIFRLLLLQRVFKLCSVSGGLILVIRDVAFFFR